MPFSSPASSAARLRTVAATLSTSALLAVGILVAAPLAAAPAVASTLTSADSADTVAPDCHFADPGTGSSADTICWLDLSAFDGATASSKGGQELAFTLPNGAVLRTTVHVSSNTVKATALPTFADAYLGQSGHYSGVSGRPALYQDAEGETTSITLTDLSTTAASGTIATRFTLVSADAESTDGDESITWSSSSPLHTLGHRGNACPAGFSGVGTTRVTCIGGRTGDKTGAAVVTAVSPTRFSQTLTGSGLEGVALGVQVPASSRAATAADTDAGVAGVGGAASASDTTSVLGGSGHTTLLSAGLAAVLLLAAAGTVVVRRRRSR